jgi:hypothetical protein
VVLEKEHVEKTAVDSIKEMKNNFDLMKIDLM